MFRNNIIDLFLSFLFLLYVNVFAQYGYSFPHYRSSNGVQQILNNCQINKTGIQFLAIPDYGIHEYQFFLEDKGEIIIENEFQKAGNVKTSVRL